VFRIPSYLQVLLFVLACSQDARATSVVRFPFDSLCVSADRILHVRCKSSVSESDAASGRISTRTRFEVLEVIKGRGKDDAPAEIELLLPGGVVGERTQFVAGMPNFHAGAETVLFLTAPSDSGSPWPLGLYQGCYTVSVDESGGPTVQLQAGVTPLPQEASFKPASHHPFQVDLGRFREAVKTALLMSEVPSDD
jgi:hypothetical protein